MKKPMPGKKKVFTQMLQQRPFNQQQPLSDTHRKNEAFQKGRRRKRGTLSEQVM